MDFMETFYQWYIFPTDLFCIPIQRFVKVFERTDSGEECIRLTGFAPSRWMESENIHERLLKDEITRIRNANWRYNLRSLFLSDTIFSRKAFRILVNRAPGSDDNDLSVYTTFLNIFHAVLWITSPFDNTGT